MTLEDIQRHRHYKPAGHAVVCGFGKVVHDTGEVAGVDHPLLQILSTTDVRRVTCPKCQTAIKVMVSQYDNKD